MIYVFGNRRYAELIRSSIEFYGRYKIDAFVVDKEYLVDDNLGLPQVALQEISCENSSIFLGVTFEKKKGPKFIQGITNRFLSLGLNLPGFDFSERPDNPLNGQGTQIFQNTIIDFGCSIGEFVQIRPGALIGHDTKIGALTYVSPGAKLGSYVEIKGKCFLGFGCTIAPYSVIGHNCLIGAGAIVKGNIPPYSVVKPDRSKVQQVKDPFQLI